MPPLAVAWSVAFLAVTSFAAGAVWVWMDRRRRAAPKELPSDWAVVPRPVFNTDERRLRRQLAEAFPNHLVMTKLQLIRFCHPDDPREMRYWYDLLSPLVVSFAVCSENGRVLAAVDVENNVDGIDSKGRRRALQIKQAVLEACRVRYARSPAGQLPTIAELQALLPDGAVPARPAQGSSKLHEARNNLAHTVAARRRERARGDASRDASDFQDSFFSTDARFDPTTPSGFDILSSEPPASRDEASDEPRKRLPVHPANLPVLRTEITAGWPGSA